MRLTKKIKYELLLITFGVLFVISLLFLVIFWFTQKQQYIEDSKNQILRNINSSRNFLKIHDRDNYNKLITAERISEFQFKSLGNIAEFPTEITRIDALEKESNQIIPLDLKKITINDVELLGNQNIPENIRRYSGAFLSVWYKTPDGYARICTNQKNNNKNEDLILFIFNTSTIVQKTENGERYYLRETVNNSVQSSVFKPLYVNGLAKIILQITVDEQTTSDFNEIFNLDQQTIGTGFFIDKEGKSIIDSKFKYNLFNSITFQQMTLMRDVVNEIDISYNDDGIEQNGKIYFSYVPSSEAYLCVYVNENELFKPLKSTMEKLILILVILILLIEICIYLLTIKHFKAIKKINKTIKDIADGNFTERYVINVKNEIGEISSNLKKIIENVHQTAEFISDINNGNYRLNIEIKAGHSPLMKNLITLNNRLDGLNNEQKKNQETLELERKLEEGNTKIMDILQYSKDIDGLSNNVIREIVSFLGVQQGGIFFINKEDPENEFLELTASYAYETKRIINKIIPIKTGLTGRAVLEKQSVYLNDIPSDYSKITSGFGDTKPTGLALIPLIFNNEVYGVIEISSYSQIEPYKIEFIEKLGDNIASTYSSIKSSFKTASLLEQAGLQSEIMSKREAEIQKKLIELSKYKELSDKKTVDLEGVLKAVNESTLTAEYDLKGNIISLNNKFTNLFEMPVNSIIGKNHKEFTAVDVNSIDYSRFWEDLRKGKIKRIREELILPTKKEIWLDLTFTPIYDMENNVYRILCIAFNVTDSMIYSKKLEHQAILVESQKEIIKIKEAQIEKTFKNLTTRENTLNSIVSSIDNAIIRIEYSISGKILDINKKYCDLTGYNKTDLVGTYIYQSIMNLEHFDNIKNSVKNNSENPIIEEIITIFTKDKQSKTLLKSDIPLKDNKGEINRFLMIATDITNILLPDELD